MAQKRKKEFSTLRGLAVWPHLNAPDTKYDKPHGVYRVKLGLDQNAAPAVALVSRIEKAIEAAIAAAKKDTPKKKIKVADKPYVMETNDDGEETGRVLFNFKMKAAGKTREGVEFTRKPALYDRDLTPLSPTARVGGGSDLVVSYEFNPFYNAGLGAGVSLRLEAVRVMELKEFSRDGKSYGFGDEDEDGDEDEGTTSAATASKDEDSDEDEDDEDF